jgi:heme-degrading monooxygenase HmoA
MYSTIANKHCDDGLFPSNHSVEEGERRTMIARIWHGWTTPRNADQYESLLKEEIFVGIQSRHMRGFRNIQLLRREVGAEVEFITIMLFDSLDAVREFAGEDYQVAVVPEKARRVLFRFDERSQHYEVRAEETGK